MKLNKLIEQLLQAQRKAEGLDVDVVFYLNEEEIELIELGQFHVYPDVTFRFIE